MELIGDYLKFTRLNKNISLEKITQDLNLSKSLIEDIENNSFPKYINEVFLIAHIRSISKYLNLDANNVVEKFKVQNLLVNNKKKQVISKPISKKYNLNPSKAFSFVSVIIISFSFYFFFIKQNDLSPDYAMTSDIPENLEASIEEIEMKLALKNKIIDKNSIDFTENINNYPQIIEYNDNNITSSSVIASLPSSNEIKIYQTKITLKFLNPTWIQLRSKNDEIIFSKLMNKNDEYSYDFSDELFLTAGNAGNIIVHLNDKVQGRAGKFGEVIESLFIDNNFKN